LINRTDAVCWAISIEHADHALHIVTPAQATPALAVNVGHQCCCSVDTKRPKHRKNQ